MALAKVTLHVHADSSQSLQDIEHFVIGQISESASAPRTIAPMAVVTFVSKAEWITDWDEETDDDVPLDTSWKDRDGGTPVRDQTPQS